VSPRVNTSLRAAAPAVLLPALAVFACAAGSADGPADDSSADDGSGGTWSGATEALKGGYGRVAVWRGSGEGPGNELLERRGALALTDPSDLDRILAGGRSEHEQDSPSRQAALF